VNEVRILVAVLLQARAMPLATVVWSLVVFVAWCVFLVVVIFVIIDLVRRDDIRWMRKALCIVCGILLPPLATAVYVIANARRFVTRRALWIACWVIFLPLFVLVFVVANVANRLGVGRGFPPRESDPGANASSGTTVEPAIRTRPTASRDPTVPVSGRDAR
jgi:hypothetical protein